MNCRHRCAAPRPGSPLPAARCAAPRSRRAFPLPRRCLDVQFALWQAANVPMCSVPFAVGGRCGGVRLGFGFHIIVGAFLFQTKSFPGAAGQSSFSKTNSEFKSQSAYFFISNQKPGRLDLDSSHGNTCFLYLAFPLKLMRSPSLQSSMYGCPLAIRHSCVPNVSPFVSVGCTDSLRAFVSSPPHLPPLAPPGVLPRRCGDAFAASAQRVGNLGQLGSGWRGDFCSMGEERPPTPPHPTLPVPIVSPSRAQDKTNCFRI